MAAREKKSPLTNLIAGGTAGFMEALICHPLDTIKVRMQLAKNIPRNAAVSPLSLWVPFFDGWLLHICVCACGLQHMLPLCILRFFCFCHFEEWQGIIYNDNTLRRFWHGGKEKYNERTGMDGREG